jgi:hypothetical protein
VEIVDGVQTQGKGAEIVAVCCNNVGGKVGTKGKWGRAEEWMLQQLEGRGRVSACRGGERVRE